MALLATAQPAPQTQAECEAAFERLMAEAGTIHELMDRDRIEIERLTAEAKVLKEDTSRLKLETRTLLVSMGAKL